jgi:hypothetical protein
MRQSSFPRVRIVFAVSVSSIRRKHALSRTELSKLAPEQAARLPDYWQKWERVRMSTARADRAKTAAAVETSYRAAGLAPPERVVWCDGPIDLARSCAEASSSSAGDNVKSIIVDDVLREVAYAIDHTLSRDVRSQISSVFRTRPPNPVSTAVAAAVTLGEPLHRERRFTSLRRLFNRLRGGGLPRWMEASFRDSSFSQHDAPPLGVFEYLRDVCGLHKQTDKIMGLLELAGNIGWIIPHRRVCWMVDRHSVLATDDRGRLHNPKGPALKFSDGWSFYAWKGVRLPSWMIERPHEITAHRIDRERDPIVRRCMIEIMTPERFIREGDAMLVAEDETGLLWSKIWTSWDAWAAVEVANGTPEPDGTIKRYFLQVPPTVRTARQAVAWTYGLTELEYRALRQRT